MWLIVKQLLIKAGLEDAPVALQDLAVTTCTISMASTTVTPSLVTKRISHSLIHSLKFLILQINYFKFPCILDCSYEFCVIKVLPHNPHLNLHIVEENLSKRGFKQRNFNLTTLPHSPTPPHWLTLETKMKYWSQPVSSFLWLTMSMMMWFQPALG